MWTDPRSKMAAVLKKIVDLHYSDVTMARWRLTLPASLLFTEKFVRRRSNKTSKIRVTGLRVLNSPVTGEFPAQMASNAENISIWWRHHDVDTQWYQVISRLSDDYNVCCTYFSYFLANRWFQNHPFCPDIQEGCSFPVYSKPKGKLYNEQFVFC